MNAESIVMRRPFLLFSTHPFAVGGKRGTGWAETNLKNQQRLEYSAVH